MPRLVSNLENLIFRGAPPTRMYEGLPGAPGESPSGPKQNDKHPKHLPLNKIPPGHGGTSGT